MKKKVFLTINENILTTINDIEFEGYTDEKTFDNIDDFNEYIHSNKIECPIDLEESIKSIFDFTEVEVNELSEYKIKHWVSNRSYGELIDMFENEEILVPKMQRNFVWDSLKCSRLIESIILGLPIPPLFLLEIDDNKYELIDGFQRVTTLSNFVNSRPWNYEEGKTKKMIPAKLSGKVAKEIANKTFKNLEKKHQAKIKRSTIPLIEFKQLDPLNFDSKYLIFERINTGSVRLNPMQIRKSLSYGTFIQEVYEFVDGIEGLRKIFSINNIKKDAHIEAFIRTICFYDLFFKKTFSSKNKGIKNTLNEYCEYNKNKNLDKVFLHNFINALNIVLEAFKEDEYFKQVDKMADDSPVFMGYINISIFESIMAALICKLQEKGEINHQLLRDNYIKNMIMITEKARRDNINPYSISTGTTEAQRDRYNISKQIVEESVNK
ncbi:DUF262 domain-containing protein [Macrococcus equipercicus]|uniref:DUF262 domain-containing protein n=1 Tax=Macrococcus equipercicus TaxID=69967 RepID=A0A9Q9BTQ1_9STAP|nr:DUF262 domain-containing protein [Macrococcus equipercicus]UTH14199.1 DUF262 domain-containing protein [Macrococcus equipercicus]